MSNTTKVKSTGLYVGGTKILNVQQMNSVANTLNLLDTPSLVIMINLLTNPTPSINHNIICVNYFPNSPFARSKMMNFLYLIWW